MSYTTYLLTQSLKILPKKYHAVVKYKKFSSLVWVVQSSSGSMGMNAAANSKAAAKLSLASSWGTAANAAYRDDGLIIGCLLFFRSIDPSRASSMYLLSTCWNRWSCLSVPIQHSSVHIPAIFVGTLLNYPSKTCWDTLCYTFYVFALTNNDVFSSSASESEEWGLTSFSHNTKACIQRVSIIRSIVIHSVL